MRRPLRTALTVGWLLALAPLSLHAQIVVGASGGVTVPTGDLGDRAGTGWVGSAGVSIPVGSSGFALGAGGLWGRNGDDSPSGGRTTHLGGMATVGYAFQTEGSAVPYIGGAVGYLRRSYTSETAPDSESSGPAFAAGLGLGFAFGSVPSSLELYYLLGTGDIDGTELLGLTFGVAFPLGGEG
jgi:hypothetical protein